MKLSEEATQAIRDVYFDLFLIAGGIQAGQPLTAERVNNLRERVQSSLAAHRSRMLAVGVPEAMADEVRLPIIALLDEAAGKAAWCREHWQSLQYTVYRHTRAGQLFFERLEELRRDPTQPVEVLEVYARCLWWGFQGEYGPERASELKTLREALTNEIIRRLDTSHTMIPALPAVRRDVAFVRGPGSGFVLAVVAICLSLVWLGLKIRFRDEARDVLWQLAEGRSGVGERP